MLSEFTVLCVLKILFLSFILQYVNYLQRKYSLNSLKLLGHTAPAQAASLLILGPFVDFWLTGNRIDTFNYTSIVTVCNQLKNIYGIMMLANITSVYDGAVVRKHIMKNITVAQFCCIQIGIWHNSE
jgi:hypothetical protein